MRSTSRLPASAGDLNPKPAFSVGEILINRRCDFYQVVRSDHCGSLARQLASRPDNTPRIYRVGNAVIVATGFKWPVAGKFRRDKRTQRVTKGFRIWDGLAIPSDFNLQASGLS